MEIIENKEICAACGGRCCKQSGCDYVPQDFENMSIDYLQSKLQEGNISIVSRLFFDTLNNGKIICVPFLYLRARNINKPIVDLLSIKTTCSMLKENGCEYDYKNRPTGAKIVVPSPNFNCYTKENLENIIIESWKQYQKMLSRLVKRLTGYSVDKKLSMDVEQLFCDVINCNFDGCSEAALEEIMDIIPVLSEIYKEEYQKVIKSREFQKYIYKHY